MDTIAFANMRQVDGAVVSINPLKVSSVEERPPGLGSENGKEEPRCVVQMDNGISYTFPTDAGSMAQALCSCAAKGFAAEEKARERHVTTLPAGLLRQQ